MSALSRLNAGTLERAPTTLFDRLVRCSIHEHSLAILWYVHNTCTIINAIHIVSRVDQEVQPKLAPTAHRLRQMFHIPLFEGECMHLLMIRLTPTMLYIHWVSCCIWHPRLHSWLYYMECESSTSPIRIWKLTRCGFVTTFIYSLYHRIVTSYIGTNICCHLYCNSYLHTHSVPHSNNTDGNKLMIFSSMALYYRDTYIDSQLSLSRFYYCRAPKTETQTCGETNR